MVIVLAILRMPAVQTWLAKRIVASQPGWALEAERIDVGPGGLEAHGIDFAMPGLTAKSEPISVRLRPSQLLRREFAVEQVTVNQLHVGIAPAKLAASAADAAPSFAPFIELFVASALLRGGPENVICRKGTLRFARNTTRGVSRIEFDGELRLPNYGVFSRTD